MPSPESVWTRPRGGRGTRAVRHCSLKWDLPATELATVTRERVIRALHGRLIWNLWLSQRKTSILNANFRVKKNVNGERAGGAERNPRRAGEMTNWIWTRVRFLPATPDQLRRTLEMTCARIPLFHRATLSHLGDGGTKVRFRILKITSDGAFSQGKLPS